MQIGQNQIIQSSILYIKSQQKLSIENYSMKKGLFTNQSSFKRAYAKIIHNVLRRHKFSRLSFIFLSFFEMLQLIYFNFYPGFTFNANIPYGDLITYILSFLNADRYMFDSVSFVAFMAIEYVLLTLLLVVFIRLAKVIINNSYWGEYQLIDELGLEIINIFLVLMKSVAFIPWCFAIMYSLKVFQFGWYSVYVNILIILLSIVLMVIFISFTFMCTSHFVYRNPFVESYMSGPKNRNSELKVIARMLLVFYLVADLHINNPYIFMIYSYLLNIFLFYRMYFYESYYDKFLDKVNLIFYFYPVYVQTLIIVHIFLPYNEKSFFVFGGLLSIVLIFYMLVRRESRVERYIYHQIKFKRQSVLLNFAYAIIDGVKYKNIPQYYIRLSGALRHHNQMCEIVDCRCRKASACLKSQMFEEFPIYNFLSTLLYSYVDQMEFNDRTALLAGYISNWKEKIVSKSLFYLDSTIKAIPPIPELCTETCVYREMLMIEDSMKKNDIKNIKNLDFNKFYDFHKKVSKLESLIELNVELTLRFWQEIEYDSSNFKNIRQLGNQIIKERAQIEKDYQELQEYNIYKEKLEVFIIYGIFIVATDGYERFKKNFQKSAHNRALKNYFNEENLEEICSEKSIVVLSGNIDNNFGGIVYSNRCMKNFFGYTSKELEHKNIKMLMPEMIGEKHDEILDNYLLKQKAAKKKDGMMITPVDNNDHLVPCYLIQKILPNLDKGIEIVGFMTKIKEQSKYISHYLLYRSDTQQTIAVSKELNQRLGIQVGKRLEDIFEAFSNLYQFQESLRTKEGLITKIKEDEDNMLLPDFNKKQLMLKMKWEMMFYGTHLRMIVLYESKSLSGTFSKSKLTEVIAIGAKSNMTILTENKQTTSKTISEQNEIQTIKLLQVVVVFFKISTFVVIFVFFYLQNNQISSMFSTLESNANLSLAVSESTFNLRNIELNSYYNDSYVGIDPQISNSELQSWQSKLKDCYYSLISKEISLGIYGNVKVIELHQVNANQTSSFETSLQDYITNIYNIIDSLPDFTTFEPNLTYSTMTPTYSKFYKIIKNADLQLILNSLQIRTNIQNQITRQYLNFNMWIVIGSGLGCILIVLMIKFLFVQRIKKRLDKAIEIFSFVKKEEVALIIDNCTYFLQYYYNSSQKNGGAETTNIETNMNEEERLNKKEKSAVELLRKEESNYFQKITMYLVIFFGLTVTLIGCFAYVSFRAQNQTLNTISLISSLESRLNYLSFLRTYSVEAMIDPTYLNYGFNLLDSQFLNQRSLTTYNSKSNLPQYISLLAKLESPLCNIVTEISNCSSINNGILNLGLTSTISSYLEQMRQIFTFNISSANSLSYLNDPSHNIINSLLPILTQVTQTEIETVKSSHTNYISTQFLDAQIIGISFIFFTILCIFTIWLPLSKVLQNESNWNKNFMNLIPYQALINSGQACNVDAAKDIKTQEIQ